MSLVEIAVIAGGAVVGWVVVSFVINRAVPEPASDRPQHWFEILGVAPSATRDEIEAAYAERLATLDRQTLRIMTDGEKHDAAQRLARLQAGYQDALRYLDERAAGSGD